MVLTLSELTAASTKSVKHAEELKTKASLLAGGQKKKRGKAVEETASAIAVPSSSRAEAKAARAAGYAETSEELGGWEPLVREEARSGSLRFGDRARGRANLAELTQGFKPETELEKALLAETRRQEQDEEMGERAKTRSVLFHAEQKHKYHAKVKSKAFARGRKKKRRERVQAEREAAAADDPVLRASLDDKAAKKRVEERLTLRHASTSAWAKNIKKRGRGAVQGTADARRDQIELGRDLRRREEHDDDEDEDDDDDYEDDDDDDDEDDDDDDEDETEKKRTKIEGMKFMVEARQDQAREAAREARKLAAELERDDDDDDDDDDEKPEKKTARPENNRPAKKEEEFTGNLRGLQVTTTGGDDAWTAAVQAANARAKRRRRPSAAVLEIDDAEVSQAPEEPERRPRPARIADMTNQELLELAMDDTAEREFAAEKLETEDPAPPAPEDDELPGWGSWTGEGVVQDPKAKKRKEAKRQAAAEAAKKVLKNNLPAGHPSAHVIINPKRIKKQANLRVAQVPYPFSSKADYERYMARPLGKEWNTDEAVSALTLPDVVARPGVAVEPMAKTKRSSSSSAADHSSNSKKNKKA